MTARRVLSVWIDSTAIEAGEVSPPKLGSILQFPVAFREAASAVDDVGVSRVQGTLELADRRPQARRATPSLPAGWRWQGTLRGDGWSASWEGARPRTGHVDMIGRFCFGWGSGLAMRGMVTRIRMASRMYREESSNTWGPDPAAPIALRDVDAVPRWPRSGEPRWPDAPYEVTFAALVDLDLEATPPPATRPRVIPYHLSAQNDAVWMVDERLPSVVCLRSEDSGIEYLLPERPHVGRGVVATPDGCWVNGADAVYRIQHGGPAEEMPALAVLATVGDAVFLRKTGSDWEIHTTDGRERQVKLPPGPVHGHAIDGDSLVAILKSDAGSAAGVRLIRVTTAGGVSVGPHIEPILPPGGIDPRWVLAGSPLRLFCGGQTAVEVKPDLSAGPRHTLPETVLSAGAVGDLIWVVTHPPNASADGLVDRWPFDTPVTYDHSRGQFWLLTLLDSTTMRPLRSHPVHATRPSVCSTADGRIWLTAGGALVSLPDPPMSWPHITELDSLIAETIDPIPPNR